MTLCTDLASSLSTFLSLRNLVKTHRQFNIKLKTSCHFLKTVFIEPACPGLCFWHSPASTELCHPRGLLDPPLPSPGDPKFLGAEGWSDTLCSLWCPRAPPAHSQEQSGPFSPAVAQVATSHGEQPCRSCRDSADPSPRYQQQLLPQPGLSSLLQ